LGLLGVLGLGLLGVLALTRLGEAGRLFLGVRGNISCIALALYGELADRYTRCFLISLPLRLNRGTIT